jgi:hypothetical protein
METANLIYHISVILISIMVFFLNITVPNYIAELICKTIGKLVPLFCMVYAGVQIFKQFDLI